MAAIQPNDNRFSFLNWEHVIEVYRDWKTALEEKVNEFDSDLSGGQVTERFENMAYALLDIMQKQGTFSDFLSSSELPYFLTLEQDAMEVHERWDAFEAVLAYYWTARVLPRISNQREKMRAIFSTRDIGIWGDRDDSQEFNKK